MFRMTVWAVSVGVAALIPIPAQAQAPTLLCDVSHTKVDAAVSYDRARGVYRYTYSLAAAPENTGYVDDLDVEITTSTPQEPRDVALTNDASRVDARPGLDYRNTPRNAVAIGLRSPSADWVSGTTPKGCTVSVSGTVECGKAVAGWGTFREGLMPGQSVGVFVLESKAPPAPREYRLVPSPDRCFELFPPSPSTPDDEQEDAANAGRDISSFTVVGQTVGPMLETEGSKYNGGGQKPSDVNRFLTYRQPTEARTPLAAGTSEYLVIVSYGPTTSESSLSATLNGTDVRNLFLPVPGSSQAVKIPLVPGSNKLQLAIDGMTQSGRLATDTDTLTFLVP